MSYTEFSVTYIHNKFWGLNSIKVPARRVILDNNWHTTDHLFKTEEQKYYFEIFWHEYMVGGEVLIPGEWNYCCVNGKFFHLEKTKSAGFIDDQESFYYTLIYDDWQNDWLTNNVNLCGTINLTGDKELVKEHLVQTTPLLNNVNNYRYLNGKRYVGEDTRILLPNDTKWRQGSRLSSKDFITINDELKNLDLGEPNRDKLLIPFLYRTNPKYHWKWLIVKAIKNLERKNIGVYDVRTDDSFRPTLQVKFNTNELYTVAAVSETNPYVYAKTLNKSKYIEEIDLSGFTDLIQLSSTTLAPEYTSVESLPKFSLRGLCEKIRSRFNWNKNLIPYMEDIATRTFAEGLGDLISSDVDTDRRCVFKNVTVTPIKRDIEWREPETSLVYKNPTWFNKLDSLIPEQKFYRNFIFSSDEHKKDHLYMYTRTTRNSEIRNTSDNPNNDDTYKQFTLRWLTGELTGLQAFETSIDGKPSWLTNYLAREPGWSTTRNNIGIWMAGRSLRPFKETKLCQTEGVQLVLPTHQYKLIEEGNEDSEELDFTRTDWFNDSVLMLIPDYERRTHVWSIRCPLSEDTSDDSWNFFFDSTDNLNPLIGKPIRPYITTELFEVGEPKTTDAKEDLMHSWVNARTYNINDNGISPMASLYHMISGTYTIKYKTYHSYCYSGRTIINRITGSLSFETLNHCDYDKYGSPRDAKPYQQRSGASRWKLADVHKENDNWVQYQIEISLPYSQKLIQLLQQYSHLHKYIFTWKIVNIGEDNATHPNPLIYKNERIQRMDSNDLMKIGKQEMIYIWINPATPRSAESWIPHLKKEGLITQEESTQIGEAYSLKDNNPFELCNKLLNIYYTGSQEYWPLLKGGNNTAIPLRIYNDTGINSKLRGYYNKDPQLSTGMVKPYNGVDYICYYRFNTRFHPDNFGFSNTSNSFRFDDGDYFVMIIPNPYSTSANSVPEYTYRERIDNMSRKSNIAYLVNGGWYDATDTKRFRWGGWTISNNHGSDGWKDGDLIHSRMKMWENEPDFFYEEFIKKEFKTNKTSNPKILNNEYQYKLNGWQSFKITSLDDEIPPFMVKYLDPDRTISVLHGWKISNARNDNDRLKEFREKLISTITDLKVKLSSINTWFALQGTDWCVSVKLNIEGKTTWDYELFTTNPRLIKSRTTDTWKFEYHNEDDVDVLINTSNELNIFGKRISQKSRYTSDTDELELRLKITPLADPKQTVASSWYKVELKTDDQDLIRDVLEIPKEQVRSVDLNVFQREQIFREIELKAAERNSEAQLLEISRERFKQKDSFEYFESMRRLGYRTSNAIADITFGGLKAGVLNIFDPTDNVAGMEQATKGAINLLDAVFEHNIATADRKARFSFGLREFTIKDTRMQQQHITNQANDRDRLAQMSARLQYPQMNNGLIYREFNKSEGLNDVYITQYYPSGKLLKYIKEYYKEYGYEVLVRDHICTGVDSIKRHLRYSNLFKNEHTSQRIKAMIEARALNGIYVTDTEIFW